jgi:hypothetical protein
VTSGPRFYVDVLRLRDPEVGGPTGAGGSGPSKPFRNEQEIVS